MGRGNVRYIALARSDTRELVFDHVEFEDIPKKRYDDVVSKVMQSERTRKQDRLTVTSEVGCVHYDTDEYMVYVVVTAPDYPQRTVFKYLQEVSSTMTQKFGSQMAKMSKSDFNSKSVKKVLVDIAQKYDDTAKVDKITAVHQQVEDVKVVMQDNITQMLNTHEKLEELETKTDNLKHDAHQFKTRATEVKKAMWCKKCKLQMIIALVILLVLGILAAIIYSQVSK